MSSRKLKRHVFVFNEEDNGGESLCLTTDFMCDEKDSNSVFANQEFSLQSCCNSAAFYLAGSPLTPELLRKLADELEDAKKEALTISLAGLK